MSALPVTEEDVFGLALDQLYKQTLQLISYPWQRKLDIEYLHTNLGYLM